MILIEKNETFVKRHHKKTRQKQKGKKILYIFERKNLSFRQMELKQEKKTNRARENRLTDMSI